MIGSKSCPAKGASGRPTADNHHVMRGSHVISERGMLPRSSRNRCHSERDVSCLPAHAPFAPRRHVQTRVDDVVTDARGASTGVVCERKGSAIRLCAAPPGSATRSIARLVPIGAPCRIGDIVARLGRRRWTSRTHRAFGVRTPKRWRRPAAPVPFRHTTMPRVRGQQAARTFRAQVIDHVWTARDRGASGRASARRESRITERTGTTPRRASSAGPVPRETEVAGSAPARPAGVARHRLLGRRGPVLR